MKNTRTLFKLLFLDVNTNFVDFTEHYKGVIMKNLNSIFKLLLFPLLILKKFTLSKPPKKHYTLVFSIVMLMMTSFSFSNAAFFYVDNDNKDAEERINDNGDISLGSSDLELGYDPGGDPDRGLQIVGMRFNNVSIPVGAVITSAKIRFRADTDDSGDASLIIRGELADDAGGFSNDDYDLSSRTKTSASVDWNPGTWTNNNYYETVDISSVIQEIVNQTGYAGDDLVIFIEPGATCTDSECRRRADSHDASNSNAPRLEVEYLLPPTAEYSMDSCLWDGSANEVIDSIGSVNGTSFNGAAIVQDSILCNGAYFDGTNDYVSMGNSFNNIFGNSNDTFTITTWIKPTSLSSDVSNHGTANTFIAKASDPSNDNLEIGITPGGQIHLYLDTSGNDTQANFGAGVITPGNWYFIAVTYDGDDVSVTINNSTTTDDRWSGNLDTANGSPFTLGTTRHIDTSFNGYMDEVKIYDSALSIESINFIYANELAGKTYADQTRTCQVCSNFPALAVDDSFNTAYQTPVTGNVLANDSGPSIQVITNLTTSPSSGTLTLNSTGAFTYTPNSGFSGTDSFEYTIQESDANQATGTVSISVSPPTPIDAINDSNGTLVNVPITENVLSNDIGDGISVISNTSPLNGTVSINGNGDFTYTPDIGYAGNDTFTYTIIDTYGSTDTATVLIVVSDATDFQEGIQDFVLINPQSTRNILGSFATLGNTVECITEKRGTDGESNSYNGTCQNSTAYNDNNYMAKYIDIDSDTTTWNSSSSNFTLPVSYNQDEGKGILWAGLFWQGSINNDESFKQRRAYVNGNSYSINILIVIKILILKIQMAIKS